MATRYSQRPSALLGITDPGLAWRVDEATLLAGIYADKRAREEAEAEAGSAKGDRPRPRDREQPAEIGVGAEGVTIKGTSNVTNDRSPEELARSDEWARQQGWTVRR